MGSISFFGNKTITSGEGGAVFTQDEELFEYLNSVRGQGNRRCVMCTISSGIITE